MRTVKLADLAVSIERRKAQLGLSGYDYVRPNSGQYRSREKRELLRAIEQSLADPRSNAPARAVVKRLRQHHTESAKTDRREEV